MLRQFCFCPRIFYFQEVMRIEIQKPIWVNQGLEYHEKELSLMRRRSMKRFSLDNADQHHGINLSSKKYNMHGKPDIILETGNSITPVEIKSQEMRPSKGQILQLCAYGMLSEEYFKKTCKKGFFLLSGKDKTYPVELNKELKNDVLIIIERMIEVAFDMQLPVTSASISQCSQCEYLNFCNDRNF